jgi:hypothetical protein
VEERPHLERELEGEPSSEKRIDERCWWRLMEGRGFLERELEEGSSLERRIDERC